MRQYYLLSCGHHMGEKNDWTSKSNPRNQLIIDDYLAGELTVRSMAEKYSISPRSIQRIIQANSLTMDKSRRQHIAWKSSKKLKDHAAKLSETKKTRKQISLSDRYAILASMPFCGLCGRKPPEVILNIDHKDANPNNNSKDNLWVLCYECNLGKRETAY